MVIMETEVLPGIQVSVKPSSEKKSLPWAGVGSSNLIARAQRGIRSKAAILAFKIFKAASRIKGTRTNIREIEKSDKAQSRHVYLLFPSEKEEANLYDCQLIAGG
jgi:hypothetical protein